MTGLGCPLVLVKAKLIVVPCMTAALLAGTWYGGIDGAAAAWLAAFPFCYGLAFRLVLGAAGISYREMLSAIRGPAVAAALMAAIVYALGTIPTLAASWAAPALAAEILIGVAAYPLLLRAIDGDAYRLARRRLRGLLGQAA